MKTNNTQFTSPVIRYLFIILLVSSGLALPISKGFAQSSQAYFIYNHIDDIASFAHPSNTFIKQRSMVQDNGNYVDATLVFKESITKIRFEKNGNFFSGMRVISNSEIWPAFAAVSLMKSAIVSMLEKEMEENPTKYNTLHRYFVANAKNMNGEQLTLFCLYLSSLDD